MRFKFLSVLILFAVFAISNSVSAGQVRGKTVNPENKAPVKGIFAIAKNQGGFDTASSPDRFIKISVTGDDGVFLLDIPEDGKGYEVIISDKEYDGFI